MKTKWFSKVVTGSFAIALIFGSATLASAKGNDKGRVQHHESEDQQKESEHGKAEKGDHKKGKSTDTQTHNKKVEKKKIEIKSKLGKSIEKRIHSSESSINNITKSINSFFGIAEDGTTDKELSKKTASHKYNSYKGKLNAEIHKLRAIDKQLAGYKKKQKASATGFDALIAKSKKLQQLALDEIKRLKTLVQKATAPKTDDGTTDPDNGSTSPEDGTTTDPGETTQPSEPVDTTTPADPVGTTAPTVPSPSTQTGDPVQ